MITRVPIVVMLNNYPLAQALRRYHDADLPGQHLWGLPSATPSSSDQFTWVYARHTFVSLGRSSRAATRSLRGVVRLLGDPIQQIFALSRIMAGKADVIYAADQVSGLLIGALRRLGVLRVPYIVVVHHPPRTRWERWALGGAQEIGVLSAHVGCTMRAGGGRIAGLPQTLMHWGPDLASPVYSAVHGGEKLDFVGAGRTNRDYSVLYEAAERGKLSGTIFEDERVVKFDNGVRRVVPGSAPYKHVLAEIGRAACVVIPLADGEVMSGLTEVADAVAANKPVIVSESVAFPYDVSGLNAGAVFPPGDSNALLRTIQSVGQNGGRTAKGIGVENNMGRFREELAAMLNEVLRRRTSA